jgi:hypothetical protein
MPAQKLRKASVRFPAPGIEFVQGEGMKVRYDGMFDPSTRETTLKLSDGSEVLVHTCQAITRLLPEG